MPHWLTGIITSTLMLLSTLIGIGPMLVLAVLKLVIPHREARRQLSRAIMWIAETWAESLKWVFALMTPTVWDIRSNCPLDPHHSYLIVSNHQSWVDIPALVQAFNRRTPYFKFFLKKELIWVPFLGLAFWALDYPFMKRYSKAHLARHPEDRGKDLEITRKACERFESIPVTVVNFLEGTRFTEQKRNLQQSPFRYLLKPKSGGVAFVMAALGTQMRSLLDVTIHYPGGRPPGFWALLSGRVDRVMVEINGRSLSNDLFSGNYADDPKFRQTMQSWVNQLWREKDQRLAELHARDGAGQQGAKGS